MPPNFANAKIYAIRSHQTEQIYIGSTTQPLYKRFSKHKTMYCSSKEIMKFEDCYIELLQEFPCANKMQLNRREGELIRSMDCINKNMAGRTRAEYKVDNKTEINEKAKQKYNCFCGGHYTLTHKARHFKTPNHLEFMRTLETTTA